MKLFRIYAYAVIFNLSIFSLIYIFFPETRLSFLREDQFMENLTAVLFFSSFLFGIGSLARPKEKKYRMAYIAIPLVGLIGFLDELSYGERIFYFTAPEIFGVDIDAFHDVVNLIFKILTDSGSYLLYVSVFAFCTALFLIGLKYRRFFDRVQEILKAYPAYGFVLISMGFIFVAITIDLFDPSIDRHQVFSPVFLEELFEMNAAFAFLFASFTIAHKGQTTVADKRLYYRKIIWQAAGIVVVISGLFFFYQNLMVNLENKRLVLIKRLFTEAEKYVDKGKFDLALNKADEMQRIFEEFGSLYIRYLVSKSRGHIKQASEYAEEIIKVTNSKNARLKDVHVTLIVYYLKKDRKKEAEQLGMRTLILWPDDKGLQNAFKGAFGYLSPSVSSHSR